LSWQSRSGVVCSPIKNYEEAVKRFESIKPLRGNKDKIRPLSPQRANYFHITHENNQVKIWLQRHNIITYNQDNTITITLGRYPTPTARLAYNNVLGSYAAVTSGFSREWVRTVHGFLPLKEGGVNFTRSSEGLGWELVPVGAPNYPEVHRVNKTKMAAVRKRFRNYLKYLRNTIQSVVPARRHANVL